MHFGMGFERLWSRFHKTLSNHGKCLRKSHSTDITAKIHLKSVRSMSSRISSVRSKISCEILKFSKASLHLRLALHFLLDCTD